MKKFLLPLLSFFALTTGFSQQLHFDQLKATADSLALSVTQQDGPGMSIGVLYRGKPVLNTHYGQMNLDYGNEDYRQYSL